MCDPVDQRLVRNNLAAPTQERRREEKSAGADCLCGFGEQSRWPLRTIKGAFSSVCKTYKGASRALTKKVSATEKGLLRFQD
jgi:hypothetical protein